MLCSIWINKYEKCRIVKIQLQLCGLSEFIWYNLCNVFSSIFVNHTYTEWKETGTLHVARIKYWIDHSYIMHYRTEFTPPEAETSENQIKLLARFLQWSFQLVCVDNYEQEGTHLPQVPTTDVAYIPIHMKRCWWSRFLWSSLTSGWSIFAIHHRGKLHSEIFTSTHYLYHDSFPWRSMERYFST